MAERRSTTLRERHGSWFDQCGQHPFVRGIATGALPPEVFARWVVQDWLYLQVYVEVLERLSRTAPKPAARARWAELAALSRDEELDLHRAYAARFDLGPADLDVEPWPVTTAYATFLQSSVGGSYGAGVAAVVPCGVDYVTIARDLSGGPVPADPRYADWISMYADPSFADAVAFMEAELDALDGDDAALDTTYGRGAALELAFWDQLLQGPTAA